MAYTHPMTKADTEAQDILKERHHQWGRIIHDLGLHGTNVMDFRIVPGDASPGYRHLEIEGIVGCVAVLVGFNYLEKHAPDLLHFVLRHKITGK